MSNSMLGEPEKCCLQWTAGFPMKIAFWTERLWQKTEKPVTCDKATVAAQRRMSLYDVCQRTHTHTLHDGHSKIQMNIQTCFNHSSNTIMTSRLKPAFNKFKLKPHWLVTGDWWQVTSALWQIFWGESRAVPTMLVPGKDSNQITWQKAGWSCPRRNVKDRRLQPVLCKLNSSATRHQIQTHQSFTKLNTWLELLWIWLLVCKAT